MSLTITPTTTDFKPVTAGTHAARCVLMVDIGTQKSANPKYRPARKVYIGWELPNETYESDGKEYPCRIYRQFTLSLGKPKKPSSLRSFLIGWRGRDFTEAEMGRFDLPQILGAGCILNVVHNVHEGTTYANVASASPLMKGITLLPQHYPSIKYELEQGRDAVFNELPEWLQDKIKACLEWNAPAAAPADDGNGHSEPEPEPEPEGDCPF
jgi:hypothetical protein